MSITDTNPSTATPSNASSNANKKKKDGDSNKQQQNGINPEQAQEMNRRISEDKQRKASSNKKGDDEVSVSKKTEKKEGMGYVELTGWILGLGPGAAIRELKTVAKLGKKLL